MTDEIKKKERIWTKEDILEMWPQAAGELRGFQRHLERNAGITAAQLDMALNLAQAEFERLKKVVYTFNIYKAETSEEAIAMLKEGKDLVVLQDNEFEVCVYTKSESVTAKRIYFGGSWRKSEGFAGAGERYEVFTFTRLNFHQVIEHLSDATKFNSSET